MADEFEKKEYLNGTLTQICLMDSEIKALKKALQNRQAELRQLINQMKADQLNASSVFRKLENELSDIRDRLDRPEPQRKK